MPDELLAYLTPANISTYLVAMNFIAFGAFGLDKMYAEAGKSRISEANLLSFAVFGGTPGAYAGRALFRHKTRKQPFSNQLHLVAAIQLVLLVFAGTFWLAGQG